MSARHARQGPAPGGPDEPLVQLCSFRVGGEDYAIDIMRVREIIPPMPVTPVPRAPAFVEGVVRLRGEVIPILDVRRRLGVPVTEPTRRTKYLIVNVAGRRLGLVVDEVTEVLRVPRAEIRPAPPLVGGDGPRFFLGVCGGESAAASGRRAHASEARRAHAPEARRAHAPEGRRAHVAARLRLLLNVKALLEPVLPGEVEAARAEAEAARTEDGGRGR